MATQTDLEISIYRRDAGSYGIEQRFTAADSEKELIASGTTPLQAGDPEFRVRSLDAATYGAYLAGQLLAEPAMRDFFNQALAAARFRDAALRFRLYIHPDAAELHNLRWETLHLSKAGAPLLTGENLTFTRYLSSDWRDVRARSAADIRALVVVSDKRSSTWSQRVTDRWQTHTPSMRVHTGRHQQLVYKLRSN